MPAPQPPQRKRRGCFFYGCLISSILLLIVFICLFIAFRFVVNTGNRLIEDYTEAQPMALPVTKLTDDQMTDLKQRVKTFQETTQGHINEATLVLTGDELNALISNSEKMELARNHVYVTMESNEIKGQISLPVDQFLHMPMLKTKGRYLNGSAAFLTSVTNGLLFVSMDSLTVKGRLVTGNFMAGLKGQNLADGFNKSTNSSKLANCESLEIKDGKLYIKSK